MIDPSDDRDALVEENARLRLALAVAEKRLSEVTDRLGRGLHAVGAGYWQLCLASGRVEVDPFWLQRFGEAVAGEHGSAQSQDWKRWLHGDDLPRAERLLKAHLKGDLPVFETEIRVRSHGDQWRWMLVSGKGEVTADKGVPERIVGAFLDITERKESECASLLAKSAADAALLAKDQFLANISHEIRTPMNGIIGMTEILLDGALSTEQREHLCTVKSSAESLLLIINDVLDFSQIESGKLQLDCIEFSLHEMLADLAKGCAPQAQKRGVELFCDLPLDLPLSVRGDAARLRRVLSNLLENAVKFTQQGEIVLGVRVEVLTGRHSRLEFSVRDTGVGIPEERQNLIFDAFTQVDGSTTRKYGGTGLGLTICRELVQLMGGQLALLSREGAGSTFSFSVDLEVVSCADVPDSNSLSRARVLVFAPNSAFCQHLCAQLTAIGLRPVYATRSEAAIAELHSQRSGDDPFDFMLLDADLQDGEAYSLAEQFKLEGATLDRVVMILSSQNHADAIVRCDRLGIAARVAKPFMLEELIDAFVLAREGLAEEEVPVFLRFDPKATISDALGDNTQELDVLLVEDNLVNQIVAVRMLERAGCSVTVANNGQEALDLFECGRFDVVFMDVQMPVMGGLEATRAIRAREARQSWVMSHGDWRPVPIVAMTAHTSEQDRLRCMEAGMDHFVAKPIRPAKLFEVLSRLVNDEDPTPNLSESMFLEQSLDEQPDDADLDQTLELLDGDEDALQQLLRLYFRDAGNTMMQLRQLQSSRDFKRLNALAHTIKGSVGVFFANVAAASAANVERLARAEDPLVFGAPLEELLTNLDRLGKILRHSLKS